MGPASAALASARGVAVESEVGDLAPFAFAFVVDDQGVIDDAAFWCVGEVEDGVDEEQALGRLVGCLVRFGIS